MTATLLTFPVFRAFDSNGAPLAGGLLYSYQAGTTTPLSTYVDQAGVTQNTNPVVLDSTGTANVWLGDNTYKLVLKDKDGVQQWSVDNIQSEQAIVDGVYTSLANTSDVSKGDALLGVLQPFTGAVAETQHDFNKRFISPEDFGAKGDGTTDDTTALLAAINAAVANNLELHCSSKTYKAASQINATIGSGNLVIVGNGATINYTGADTAAYYDAFLGITGTIGTVTIRDLNVISSLSGAISTTRQRGHLCGLVIKTVSKIHLENVNASGFPMINIWLYYVDSGSAINCSGINACYAGLIMQGCTDVNVIGGNYNENGGLNDATIEGYGLSCATRKNAQDRDNSRISIQNVTANNNIGKGIDVHQVIGITVMGCKVSGFTYDGIYVLGGSNSQQIVKDVMVIGNYVNGDSPFWTNTSGAQCFGILVGGGTYAYTQSSYIVSGNTVKNVQGSSSGNVGIQVQDGNPASMNSSFVVSDNIVIESSSGSYPQAIISASLGYNGKNNVVISGNTLVNLNATISDAIYVGCSSYSIAGNFITVGSANNGLNISIDPSYGTIGENIINGTFSGLPISITTANVGQLMRGNISNNVALFDSSYAGRLIGWSAAIPPSSGTWTQGTILFDPSISSSVGTPVGCVRLTSGSGNVLGTDWRKFGVTV